MAENDKRLFLGASLQSRDGTLTKDALVTNGYIEKAGDNVKTFKRGGLNLVTALGTGLGQGMTNFVTSDGSEILYAVNNAQFQVANVPTVGGAWSTNSNFGGGGSAVFSFGGLLWQVGGDNTPTSAYYASTVSASRTLAATGIWGGVNRSGQAPIVIGSFVYLIGGHQSSNDSLTKAEVWRSGDGSNWTQLTAAAAFGARTYCKVAKIGSTMYFLGGQDGTGTWSDDIYSSTDGVTWTLVTTTPAWGGSGASLRIRYGVCSFSGRIWVMGGSVAGTRKNDVYYSSDGNTWTSATASAAWSIRTDPNVFPIAGGSVMALIGGIDGGGQNLTMYSTVDGATWSAGTSVTGQSTIAALGANSGTHKGFGWVNNAVGSLLYSTSTTTSGTSLATITIGAGDMADFSKNLAGTQIMIRVGTAAYKLATATQVVTQVTDGDYPTLTVRGNPYLNGIFYVMTPSGDIKGSDDEDCASWDATNTISAEFEPDSGVCLAKYNNYITAFGQWTTQMFWDAANPTGSSLSPVENGVLLIGCAHGNSVAQIESTLLWIAQRKGQGSSFQKGRFVAMLEGQSYVQISTPDVDRVLDTDDLATVYSCVASLGGHNFYCLGLGTTGVTLVYDLTQKLWYVWTQYTTGSAKTVSALTQSNGLATATSTSHGFSDGDPVTIAGATPSGFNQTNINVNVTDANTFTYPVSSALSSPATGTITATSYSESFLGITASCNYQNAQVFQAYTGGNIYSMLDSIFQDNSVPINFKIRTSPQDKGTNGRKFCTEVAPLCDLTSSVQTALLRYSDNDCQTYSYYRRFDISDVAPQEHRWGNYRRRTWEWRYTGNTAHRISALELDQEMER